MDLDSHPSTTPEIRSLCADLGVLGRVDFKNLLKWRLAVRKSRGLDGKRKAALRGGVAAAEEEDVSEPQPSTRSATRKAPGSSDSDEKILEEMAELQQGVDARARRDKKKKAKLRAKERVRTALGLVGQDEEGATGASEMDLFSLARIKSKGGLRAVQAAAAPGVDASRDSDDDLGDAERRAGARGRYDDSSEEEGGDEIDGRANDARLEAELDLMWREYKARHTPRRASGSRRRRKVGTNESPSAPARLDRKTTTMRLIRRAPRCAAPGNARWRRRCRTARLRTLCCTTRRERAKKRGVEETFRRGDGLVRERPVFAGRARGGEPDAGEERGQGGAPQGARSRGAREGGGERQ